MKANRVMVIPAAVLEAIEYEVARGEYEYADNYRAHRRGDRRAQKGYEIAQRKRVLR